MGKFIAACTLCFFSAGIASADDFNALIKSVKGNKVTINRSDKDNKFDDQVLTAIDKVKVTKSELKVEDDGNGNFQLKMEQVEIKDGLKSKIFDKEVRARITTDGKNNITEIRIRGGLFGLLDKIEIPDLQFEIPLLRIEKPCAGIDSADDFNALIKSVKGNKVTINRSDKDNKFDDQVLTAIDKVKVTQSNTKVTDNGDGTFSLELRPGRSEVKEGLKSDIVKKAVRAKIVTDAKNNITEIHIGGDGLFGFFLEIPDLQFEIPSLKQ
jgi:hypothetical protein